MDPYEIHTKIPTPLEAAHVLHSAYIHISYSMLGISYNLH